MSFDHVLLCIRGTLADGTDHARARDTHNATAGNPEGVAAARALGDLSHKVYTAVNVEKNGAKQDELLILDIWQTPEAIQKFFGSPAVQTGGAKLFKQRDPVVFMPAKGAFGFNIVAPMQKNDRYIGLLRGKVKSPEAAIEAFGASGKKHQNLARQRGQLSHELYVRLDGPGKDGLIEILGVDTWFDPEGMAKHYQETMGPLMSLFPEPPVTSIWNPPAGLWVEW
ncbi:MAG: hypothetical protein U0228_10255 [Myxococcaceae bacterium]